MKRTQSGQCAGSKANGRNTPGPASTAWFEKATEEHDDKRIFERGNDGHQACRPGIPLPDPHQRYDAEQDVQRVEKAGGSSETLLGHDFRSQCGLVL
jgi:hypothetical protein